MSFSLQDPDVCILICADIDNLPELLTHLTNATPHWFNVGLFLNVGYGQLKSIRHDYHSQPECLREMLAAWLHKTEDASPAKIVFALKKSKLVEQAYDFASEYGESCKFVMLNYYHDMFLSESPFASTGRTVCKSWLQ